MEYFNTHLLSHIASFLHPITAFIPSFILVSKNWNIVDKDELLWKLFCGSFLWCAEENIPKENIKSYFISAYAIKRRKVKVAIQLVKTHVGPIQYISRSGAFRINVVLQGESDQNTFDFEHIYDENSGQNELYNDMAKPVVDKFLCGYNGSIIVHREEGQQKILSKTVVEGGLLIHVATQILEYVSNMGEDFMKNVEISIVQIIFDRVTDVLNNGKDVVLREKSAKFVDGNYVRHPVRSLDSFKTTIANADRTQQITIDSSYANTVIMFFLTKKDTESMLHFVDFPLQNYFSNIFTNSLDFTRDEHVYAKIILRLSDTGTPPKHGHLKITRILQHVFGDCFSSAIFCLSPFRGLLLYLLRVLRLATATAKIITTPKRNVMSNSNNILKYLKPSKI